MKATRTEHVEPADRIFTTAPVWHVLLLSTIAIVLPPSKAFCVVASTSTQRHLLRPGMNHFIRVGTTERDGTQHRKEVELQKQKYFWVQYLGYPVCREEAMTSLVFTIIELPASDLTAAARTSLRLSLCAKKEGAMAPRLPSPSMRHATLRAIQQSVQSTKYLAQNHQRYVPIIRREEHRTTTCCRIFGTTTLYTRNR